ncbi:DUF3854 domain-containing protein [Fuerstiella marisgermanici]|uniref:DUF3854 domain-containing protein n=1 Tax=Fuerstiella marisgermanici TaxID=1891926 RepID=A0A1P8WBW2_9PLAN|nr:DUF3854 domain-containing protein [Fuerstiella marisgermanici]APZ91551.1 hypothetical protein Fuma_01140 [Fuerstiella marisgermanici]
MPIVSERRSAATRHRRLPRELLESLNRRKRCKFQLVNGRANMLDDPEWDCDAAEQECDDEDVDDDTWGRRKLESSGLKAKTISDAQITVNSSTDHLDRILNRDDVRSAGIVFPFFDLSANPIEYHTVRFRVPHRFGGKKPRVAKYLCPTGEPNRSYFPPDAIAAINAGEPLLITEGILKALASTQAGCPCIGLMGVWNWMAPQSDDEKNQDAPRRLIADLSQIRWEGRDVIVMFDFDKKRNSKVNLAAVRLAEVLTRQGANARIYTPPRAGSARAKKNGIDDWICRRGEAEFANRVKDMFSLRRSQTIDVVRRQRQSTRRHMMEQDEGGIFLDRSATGSGKSHIDTDTIRRLNLGERALNLQPTHANCQEVLASDRQHGIEDSAAYPKHDPVTCPNFSDANKAQLHGLSFRWAVCPDCSYRNSCLYLSQCAEAKESLHMIATHKRGELTMQQIASGTKYIAIHEDPIAMLRPQYVAKRGLATIEQIAREVLQKVCENDVEKHYFQRMAAIAKDFDGYRRRAIKTENIPLPERAKHCPARKRIDQCIWEIVHEKYALNREAMQLVRCATDGRLVSLVAAVDEFFGVGGKRKLTRRLVGNCATPLPRRAKIVINDATASLKSLAAATEREIHDITPEAIPRTINPTVQIPRDVTRRASRDSVADTLRGIIHDIPYQKIGLITHKNHLDDGLIHSLGEAYRDRVSTFDWFGGTKSRGSNEWYKDCDCMIVLGTPRVAPAAIREHLIRLNKPWAARIRAAAAGWPTRENGGTLDAWLGKDESGQPRVVRTGHYADHDWHDAYTDLVTAQLKQAIGRARGCLTDGIRCYVVSTENICCSDPQTSLMGAGAFASDGPQAFLSKFPLPPLKLADVAILDHLKNGDSSVPVPTRELAAVLGVAESTCRERLQKLEKAGRVRRVGQRKGWIASS